MKTLKLIALSLLAATAANAADLPRKSAAPAAVMAPVPMAWQGGYVGGHIAGVSGKFNYSTGGSQNIDGLAFGLQAGYDMQFNQFVVGLVGDASFANVRGSAATSTGIETSKGSIRARAGYLISPTFLLYGTAGLGIGNGKVTEYVTPSTAKNTHTGLTVGFGGEVKFDRNWSGFAEYRHTNYGSQNYNLTAPGVVGVKGTTGDLRLGVNYRF